MAFRMLHIALYLTMAVAMPLEQQTNCASYTIIDTRGTSEQQGESVAFRTLNSKVKSQLSGGKLYNTVYPADFSQVSTTGTQDIINHIAKVLGSSPSECFILEGYSQGAAATVNALSKLSASSASAVKGVLLFGNPERKAGLACNVDMSGGTSTKNVNGLQVSSNHIPDAWISKVLDVCNYGDGVCDTTHGSGINAQHLAYPNDAKVQDLGANFILQQLRGSSTSSDKPQTSKAADQAQNLNPFSSFWN